MDMTQALDVFEMVYLRGIEAPYGTLQKLQEAGFSQTARKTSVDDGGGAIVRVLYEAAGLPFAVMCVLNESGLVSDAALVVPEGAGNLAQLVAHVEGQPNVRETTQETRHHFAFAPEDVSWTLVDSRFWTSKAKGEVGVNWVTGPALLDFADGTKGVALSASRNLAEQDPLDPQEEALLRGPASDLEKYVLIFSEMVTKVCPDMSGIIEAGSAYGYEVTFQEDGSFELGGGHGPGAKYRDRTSSMFLNYETKAAFEFALTFILDERITADTIRQAVERQMGLDSGSLAHGQTPLILGDRTYTVEHRVESAMFGNHALLLWR